MTELNIITIDDQLVVDSRLIAEDLGIEHRALLQTLKKHQETIEQSFGQLTFKMETVTNSVGAKNTVKFYYLNENQATLLMTMSRNTDQVIKCKVNLVKAFSKAKEALSLLYQKEKQPEPERVLPARDIVDYIDAAQKLTTLPSGILKQLLTDGLTDQISLEQNLKYLPVAEKPKQYTIVKVRAKQLGYSDMQIGDGKHLGKFVKSQLSPSFQEMVGRYPVYHYEIGPDLDSAIHLFFQ